MEILLPIGAMFGLYVMANNGTSERKRQGFRGRRSQLPNTNTPNRNFPVENKEAVMEHLNYYKTNPNAPKPTIQEMVGTGWAYKGGNQ